MKRILPVVLTVLLLGGFAVWWFSPTQVVKRRTKSFLKTISIEASSGRPARQMKALGFSGMLAKEVAFENPEVEELNGIEQREDIDSGFTWFVNNATSSEFKVLDFRDISVTENSAKVDLAVDALVVLPTYRPADGTYEVNLLWEKVEDEWRLTSIKWKK